MKTTTTLQPNRKRHATKRSAPATAATTDRRFVLVRHTVQIKSDFDGLQGAFATVIRGDDGDGKIIVRIPASHCMNRTNQDRDIMYFSGEWEHVVMDDAILHGSKAEHAEAATLIRRSANLIGWELDGIAPHTPERYEASERRRQKLKVRIRELQRRENERKAYALRELTWKPFCSSIVLWTGKEAA